MGTTQEVNVQWNNFASHFREGFSELRENEELFDITLASGSRQIKAHKVILSACSSFFRSVISSVSSHQHPLIYLKGIDFHHLESILSFMYNGEVQVVQEDLQNLLSVAEELEIKGLSNSLSPIKSPPTVLQNKSSRSSVPSVGSSEPSSSSSSQPMSRFDDDEVEEIVPDRSESHDFSQSDNQTEENSEVYEEDDESLMDPMLDTPFLDVANGHRENEDCLDPMMDIENESLLSDSRTLKRIPLASNKSGYTQVLNSEISKCFDLDNFTKKFQCKMCEYTSPRRDTMRSHVEAMHIITDGFECTICGRIYKTRNSLKTHRIRTHKHKRLPLAP